MPVLAFTEATKEQAKARLALQGPSGSGKTYTALLIAQEWGTKTGVVDTENRSALKYARCPGGCSHPDEFDFRHLPLTKYDPSTLIEVLALATAAQFDTLIIDSFTHFWSGTDGMLEQVEKAAKRSAGGNNFGGWKEMRPVERRMLGAMLAFEGHLIITMRSKTEYAIEEDARGRKVPRKIGLKADQREGLDYEMDVVGEMDLDNTLTITKSRCRPLSGAVINRPGKEFADTLSAWLNQGETRATPAMFRQRAIDARDDVAVLRSLHDEVTRHGLVHAAVPTEDGSGTTLGEFITTLGRAAAQNLPKAA